KKQSACHVGEKAGIGAVRSGVNVLDEDGAGGRAIAPPELIAVNAVVSREKQRPIHVRQVVGIGSQRTRANVANSHGAGRRAVALPDLLAVNSVVGREK